MLSKKILGKDIKYLRSKVLRENQPKFAKWLSSKSGEIISSRIICRMENYGQLDACNPVQPSQAIAEVVLCNVNLLSSKALGQPKSKQKKSRKGGPEMDEIKKESGVTNESLVKVIASQRREIRNLKAIAEEDLILAEDANKESLKSILRKLKDLFDGDEKRVEKWLTSPNSELKGKIPKDFIASRKAWVIEDLVDAIGSGIPT